MNYRQICKVGRYICMQIRKVHGINGVGINGDGTDKVGMVGASTVYVGTIQNS